VPNPYCIYLLGAGSKMDKQRRLRLAQILKSKSEASTKGVGDSIPPTSATAPTSPNSRPQHLPPTIASPPNPPSPNHPPSSPAPIAVVPLALAGASAEPAPLDKGKRVVVVPSDDEEDSAGGQVFKRRRPLELLLKLRPPPHLLPPKLNLLGNTSKCQLTPSTNGLGGWD